MLQNKSRNWFLTGILVLTLCTPFTGCGSKAEAPSEGTETEGAETPNQAPEIIATGAVKALGGASSNAFLQTLNLSVPPSPEPTQITLEVCAPDPAENFSCPEGGSLGLSGTCASTLPPECGYILKDVVLSLSDCALDGFRFTGSSPGTSKIVLEDCDPCGRIRLRIFFTEDIVGTDPEGNFVSITGGSQWTMEIPADAKACDSRVTTLVGFLGSVFIGETLTCQSNGNPVLTSENCFTDLDRDGIDDLLDNCPGTANPDQADSNLNGVGTACEASPEGIYICQSPSSLVCEISACESHLDCGGGQACIEGCCVEDSGPRPETPPALKLQKVPLPGSECIPGSSPEDVAAACGAPDCLCGQDGFCVCLTIPAGCGDCFLQEGEECETGDNCPDCDFSQMIPEAQCGDGFTCDKQSCLCLPLPGESDFCLGPDDDCDGRGTCETRYGFGASFCYAPSCPAPGGLEDGVYCAADPFLPGTGEARCEGLENALSSSEFDCVGQGAFACCIPASGNYCPGGESSSECTSIGGVCEERSGLGNKFCWTNDASPCPAIPLIGLSDGVYCGPGEDNRNICGAVKSTTETSLEINCVQQESGDSCCATACPLGGPPPPQCGSHGDCEAFMGPGATCTEGCCAPPPASVESDCLNGLDDDEDGFTDCDDSDCKKSEPSCDAGATETDCHNGIDDDGDFSTDCADFDCHFDPGCVETDCTDTIDNDGDGQTDCADFDCSSDSNCREEGAECADTIDNDGDGFVDCFGSGESFPDFDCFYDPVCHEQGEECSNGEDDDGDGLTDCDDSSTDDCFYEPACQLCPSGNQPGQDCPCSEGQFCDFNQCCQPSVCGDFFCDPTENCPSCSNDCCIECVRDSGCPFGQTCEGESCEGLPCAIDGDCPEGSCTDGFCKGVSCTYGCPSGGTCVGGSCEGVVCPTRGCGPNASCVDGFCQGISCGFGCPPNGVCGGGVCQQP